jgi:hypothetical protein
MYSIVPLLFSGIESTFHQKNETQKYFKLSRNFGFAILNLFAMGLKERYLFISNAKIQLKLRENGPVKIPVFSRPGGIKHKPR